MADFYVFNLKAGVELQATVRGRVILLDDIGTADGIDITPVVNGSNGRTMPKRKKAFKCWTDYDGVILRADVDTTVSIFLSVNDVSLGFADGALVNVVGQVQVGNDPANRVPVDIGGGNVEVTATSVGINNTDETAIPVRMLSNDDTAPMPVRTLPLGQIVDKPAVVIGTGAAQAMVNDATLKRLRVRNASVMQTVAIGGAGVTMGSAAVILRPGDTWHEDDAAGAAWYATADAAGATVCVQGLK